MPVSTLMLWAALGFVAGWLLSAVVRDGYGVFGEIVIGLVSAFLGAVIFRQLQIAAFAGMAGTIVVAFVGASALLVLLRAIARGKSHAS